VAFGGTLRGRQGAWRTTLAQKVMPTLEKAKTTFLPSRLPVVKLKMPNLCSCAGQRTLSRQSSRGVTGEPNLLVGHVLLQLGHLLRHRREDSDRPVIGRHDLPRAQLLELSQKKMDDLGIRMWCVGWCDPLGQGSLSGTCRAVDRWVRGFSEGEGRIVW
jgi:hypothetical protein